VSEEVEEVSGRSWRGK